MTTNSDFFEFIYIDRKNPSDQYWRHCEKLLSISVDPRKNLHGMRMLEKHCSADVAEYVFLYPPLVGLFELCFLKPKK